MTPSDKSFNEVLKLFEKHGWKLYRIIGCNRVFVKSGESPCVIPVRNRKVEAVYVEEVVQLFSEQENEGKRPK